jgi:hypothetical protein
MICHNGEINTLRGNVNWIARRQGAISSPDPRRRPGQDLAADLRRAVRLGVVRQRAGAARDGRLLGRARDDADDSGSVGEPHADGSERRAFYEYHAAMMEPWDGPASIAFTDGRQIGATLDRNGLRPSRYIVTDDDLVIMGSECGCLPVPEERIVKKWRLQPGKMFLVDLEKGRIIDDQELKEVSASAKPYAEWIERIRVKLDDVDTEQTPPLRSAVPLLERQQSFAYTQEDLKIIMEPIAASGEEPTGSMGNDSPLAVLSSRNKTLAHYFKQLFAQVTNPAIDPIREELVTSLVSFIGPEAEPARHRRDESAVAARSEPAGARLLRDGEDPAHRALYERQVQVLRARPHLSGRVGQGGGRGAAGIARRAGRGRGARGLFDHRHFRPPGGRPSVLRFRRCLRCRRSTSTWSAAACAPAPGSSSKPAAHARCTTLRCSAAMAPKPSTRILRSRPSSLCTRTAPPAARRSRISSRRSARA